MITTVTLNPAIDTRYFIEDFKEGRLFRAEKTIKSPGGKGLNVTKVLRQMGADVVATGIIGGKKRRMDTGKSEKNGYKRGILCIFC